jgi:hypothetical protein
MMMKMNTPGYVCSILLYLVLAADSSISAGVPISRNETAVLSRHKRFLAPVLSGWTFTFRPTLIIPMVTPFNAVFTQLFLLLPMTFKMDNLL